MNEVISSQQTSIFPGVRGRFPLLAVSGALTALIYILISIGGLVRNKGAGLSCPDWPLCHGQVVPAEHLAASSQVFVEWFHRLVAGGVSLGLVAIAAVVLMNPFLRGRLGAYVGLALALLASQVVLGGLTVIGLLSPKWVVSHLAVGLAFFGTVLVLTLKIRDLSLRPREAEPRSPWRGLAGLGLSSALAIYAQAILGGLVSSNHAGLACPDFPTCNGAWIPPLAGLVKFQFLHRAGAILATVAVVAFLYRALRSEISGLARAGLRLVPALLTFQILLGAGMVFAKIPMAMSVAHLATAAALLGLLLVMVYEIRRSS